MHHLALESDHTQYTFPFSNSRIGNKVFALILCGLLLTLLGACDAIGVAIGARLRLEKIPVTALSAKLMPATGISPGSSARLVITAMTIDGKELVTVGAGQGSVLFDSFVFDASIVKVDDDGQVSLSDDPRVSYRLMPHLKIVARGHPDLVANLDIPVRYNVPFKAHFPGEDGASGSDGLSGSDGTSGSSGSLDPDNPSAGGNGGNGGAGGNGENGQDGSPGEAVHVWMRLTSSTPALLQVKATSKKREKWFLIDPNGGTLSIDAYGGQGGSAGLGGSGGRGGAGGIGSPNGSVGFDGSRGIDGLSGHDGEQGTIEVSVDPSAVAYLNCLKFSKAMKSPKIRIEAVTLPWG